MIRLIYRTYDGRIRTDLQLDELADALADLKSLLWLDLVEEPPATCEPILLETFGFHPLAVDDALQESHVPKIDDWDQYVCLVLHAVHFNQQDKEQLDTLELDVFLGPNYLVTHRVQPIPAVDRVWLACHHGERHLHNSAAYLLYKLADELVADYMPVVEAIDEAIDDIEDTVFSNPTQALLEQIFTLKRSTLHLRRIMAPQREVLNKLARGDYAVLGGEDRLFFRDVYDHLVRLHDITEGLRDLVGGALDTYLSVVNNRMNDVMKMLTIITTLFMPLTFLTGFFGMNFFQPVTSLTVWTDRLAFVIVLVVMCLAPVGMFLWMRKRAWM